MRHTIFLLVPAAIAAILSGCGGKPAAESGEEALAQGDYKAAAKFFRAAVNPVRMSPGITLVTCMP